MCQYISQNTKETPQDDSDHQIAMGIVDALYLGFFRLTRIPM